MEIETMLDCLEQDFQMLKDGDWVPDDDSCDASLDMVAKLRAKLADKVA